MNSEAQRTIVELAILTTKCDDANKRKEIINHLTAIKNFIENPHNISESEKEKRIEAAQSLYNIGTCGISMKRKQVR